MTASSFGGRSGPERHFVDRAGWLRAAVLGANDGLLSTASLVLGVTAAAAEPSQIVVAAISGLAAGAMSMAAGEYVSVSSQADSERAGLRREADEIARDPHAEADELAAIYVARGLGSDLAGQVARELMATDALGAHARDELGLSREMAARPIQAAVASAASFSVGATVPLLCALFLSRAMLVGGVVAATLLILATLGAVGARVGGAPMGRAAFRVLFWGALAMAVTSTIGRVAGSTT